MDKIQSELQAQRQKFVKALEQGQQIENLQSAPEWEFFIGWIKKVRDTVKDSLTSDDYVNDHNGYLKALATVQAYESILKGVDQFQRAFTSAGQKLKELDEYEDA